MREHRAWHRALQGPLDPVAGLTCAQQVAGVGEDSGAAISIAFSGKDNAAAIWEKTFGFHPLLAFLDRPEVASRRASAGRAATVDAGSITAADRRAKVLDLALEPLPAEAGYGP